MSKVHDKKYLYTFLLFSKNSIRIMIFFLSISVELAIRIVPVFMQVKNLHKTD
jgi:predicted class III extradiol MEMO1 family dioxygenase